MRLPLGFAVEEDVRGWNVAAATSRARVDDAIVKAVTMVLPRRLHEAMQTDHMIMVVKILERCRRPVI